MSKTNFKKFLAVALLGTMGLAGCSSEIQAKPNGYDGNLLTFSNNDEIYHNLVSLVEDAYRDGTPNWDYIRPAIAASMEKKKDLEAIIHPYVIRRAKSLIKSTKKPIVLDVPLLFPSGMDELCDATLLVVSSSEKQKARLEQEGRDASSLLKINASYPLEEAKEKADFIVENDAGIEELYRSLEALPFD